MMAQSIEKYPMPELGLPGSFKNLIMRGLRFSVVSLLLTFSSSCGNRSLSPKEYVRFLNSEESGLIVKKKQQNILFSAKMQPPEVLTLLNAPSTYSSYADFLPDMQNYKQQLNFIFLISDIESHHLIKETIFDENRYGALLSYANTELQNDFELQTSDGKSIPCSIAHIEAANAVNPVVRIALAFHNTGMISKECTLVFNDNLFNTGKTKFLYKKGIFERLPKLKI